MLEDPEIVLRKQADKEKQKLLAELKADGVGYEERIERLEEVTHPKPLAEWLAVRFDAFARMHPWVGGRDIRPKSIGRDLWESFGSFGDYVKRYGLERSEGVLLRYLSQLYRTLQQNVPVALKTPAVDDAIGFFRTTIELTDTSLLEEWESLLHPELLVRRKEERERVVEALWVRELSENPRSLAARVRSEMHLLVHALAQRDFEGAAERVDAGSGRPLGRRPARGGARPLLRRARGAARHPRGAPPPVDPDPADRRAPVGGAADAARPGRGPPLGDPRPRRPAAGDQGRSAAARAGDDRRLTGGSGAPPAAFPARPGPRLAPGSRRCSRRAPPVTARPIRTYEMRIAGRLAPERRDNSMPETTPSKPMQSPRGPARRSAGALSGGAAPRRGSTTARRSRSGG